MGRFNNLMNKERLAQETYDRLKDEVPRMKQEYADATKAREDQATFITSHGGTSIAAYDPT